MADLLGLAKIEPREKIHIIPLIAKAAPYRVLE
jgi:hypothetical protein